MDSMAIKGIIQVSNRITPKILLTKCNEIKSFDTNIQTLAKDLLDTAYGQINPQAAGLAAPQIGIPKRMCLVRKFITKGEEEIIKDYILVNPTITNKSKDVDIRYEACLSIPGVYGAVERYKSITVNYYDETGQKRKLKANGFFARIIQHELDHLDGVLYTQKIIGELFQDKDK